MPGWLKLGRHRNDLDFQYPGETPLHSLRCAIVDTELTSLDSRSNRLLSIAAITMEGTKILLRKPFCRVVNPGVTVPAQSVLIHKLRPNEVESGEPASKSARGTSAFHRQQSGVGHFVSFDLKALRKELGDSGQRPNNPAIDTARVHRWILRHGPFREDLEQQLENISLAALAKLYQLDFHEAHHALDDAFVTACLWQKLIWKLEAMKVGNLPELLRIGRA
jgi:DNA polymerase III subunit epsilon